MQYIPFDLELYRSQMRQLLGSGPKAHVFWDALDFATDAHDDQWRRSGEAYIMHPCSVAKILAEEMDVVDPEILSAALLHDTVEDVDYVTTQLVGEKFGSYVAAIVEGCTKVTKDSSDKQALSKKVHRKIFSGAALRPEVMLVKLADRLHNLRTLGAMPKRKRQKISDETLDIYAPLATVFGLFSLKREMYNLALSYKFPKQGAKLLSQIRQLAQSPEATEIVQLLEKNTREVWLNAEVTIRTKGLWAYYDTSNRILRKEIDNPLEILIIAENAQSCYAILGILNQTYPPIPRTIRDFIANPKPTGYQGLHARTNIKGQKYLFKIRTEDMARRAQRGLFQDWSSKSNTQRRFIREIKELFGVIASGDVASYREVIAASGKKEIYTYTPGGDLFCLPAQSTVLDFAFRVHTDIGHSCTGAMIGSRKVSANHRLADGDVIRVLRTDHPLQFQPAMLALCRTPRARAELSRTFRIRRQKLSQVIGRSIVTQEMLRYGLPFDLLEKKELQQVLHHFSLTHLDELYIHLGEGRVSLSQLIPEIKEKLYQGKSPLVNPTGQLNRVELDTLDPVTIKISACCKPSPTDKGLFAFFSERGLSIHHKECPQLKRTKFQREDIVNLRWDLRNTRVDKIQSLVIMAATQHRVMMLLGVAPVEMRIVDITLLSKTPTPNPAWEIRFQVPTLYVLRKALRHFDKSALVYEFDFEY
ncbi:guanosine polyphosphate synthetase/pyrophosphohydrolase [Desulfocapsa sulfexigens DSM 10523]|uniref:Guanosine polyphosphate synthetase/pyrophosphohydrolase n=2 Tax=Desulfocapsa TaxID=53318 RepID=M1PQ08_DESSD|nr:guanosine polyphosphate synthetase/pyrophosphohydrolase [Desulfocapsa sulfexigens DSM 10523]